MSTMLSAYAARAIAVAAASRPNRFSGIANAVASVLVFGALLGAAQPAAAQFVQQGAKLVGSGAVGAAEQGISVALSADGNTAMVGGLFDNSGAGAAWIFSQSGGVWTQQGSKQVGAGAVGAAFQGTSVALSADSSTAIVGGPDNNSDAGAAWVFSLGGNVKLPLGSGAAGAAFQGFSVVLSADGNTAIVGGPGDDSYAGAAWVFIQSGGVWSQQGSKLVGSGGVGASQQGYSIALSADGNTAIVGGPFDSVFGAVWVFARSGGLWSQQRSKLVDTSISEGDDLGFSVALSADGATAIVGGPFDNSNTGAAWVFTAPSHIAGLLSAAPTSGAAPLTVAFRAIGLPLPMTYTLNFGDGTSGALAESSCFGSRSGVQCSGSASHTYSSAGIYDATLVNASGSTLGAATITAGGNLVRPLRPLLPPRGTPPPLSPPVAISTPTPERHSLDR